MDARQVFEAMIERLTAKREFCLLKFEEHNQGIRTLDTFTFNRLLGQEETYRLLIQDLTQDLAMYNLLHLDTDLSSSEQKHVNEIVEEVKDYRVTVLNDLLYDYRLMLEVEEEGLPSHIESKSYDMLYRQGLHEGRLQMIQFVIDDLEDFKEWLVPLPVRIMNDND